MDKEERLAFLLADGSGDFDFVRCAIWGETVILQGHVPEFRHKQRAEELARYVGFTTVANAIRIHPMDTTRQ